MNKAVQHLACTSYQLLASSLCQVDRAHTNKAVQHLACTTAWFQQVRTYFCVLIKITLLCFVKKNCSSLQCSFILVLLLFVLFVCLFVICLFVCLFVCFQVEAARNVSAQNIPSNFKDLVQKTVSQLVIYQLPSCSNLFLVNLIFCQLVHLSAHLPYSEPVKAFPSTQKSRHFQR